VNERLIKEDQLEYQEELRSHYKDMLSELSAIMNEQVRLSPSMHRKCPFYPPCHKDRKESLSFPATEIPAFSHTPCS
jgi:hypothetical protein